MVAAGLIEAMIEAEAKIWDIAAASVIIEEAGGRVTDLCGQSISASATSIVATNGLIHDEILALLKAPGEKPGQFKKINL